MKKLFTLVVLLTCFIGARADWKQVYKVTYSSYTGFPYFVMGYVPEWNNGIMTDFGATYRYETQANLDGDGDGKWKDGESSVSAVMNQGGTEYQKVTGAGPYWHQYFIADGIPTSIGGNYKVVAKVKASAAVTIGINMGWGWGANQSKGTQVAIPANDEFQTVEWEYSEVGGTSCNLVAQPGTCTDTIKWQDITVYEFETPTTWVPIYQNDGTDVTTVMKKYFKNYLAATTSDGAIVVESLEPDHTYTEYFNDGGDAILNNDWDTQFFIALPEALKSGVKFKLSMNVKADNAASAQFQAHKVLPEVGAIEHQNNYDGTYIGNLATSPNGDNMFGKDWNVFEATATKVDNMGSICLNLECYKPENVRTQNTYYFKDIVVSVSEEDYNKYFVDPLASQKLDLQAAIDLGNAQNSFAKTESSWTALTNAISSGNTALTASDATAESLTAAKTAIEKAIAGLKLQDGYTNLTKDMYYNWSSATAPTYQSSGAGGCDYVIGTSTGQPYGHGSVPLLTFADLSTFDKLYILATGGTPRVLLNRDVDGGQCSATESESHLIDNTNNGCMTWASGYFTTEGSNVTVDLKQLATNKGFAHLHTIKTVNGNVTVSDMLLYRTLTISDAGKATFGTLYKNAKLNGATVSAVKYADGKVALTTIENGTVPAGVGVLVEGEGEILPTFDVEAGSVDSDLKVSNGTVAGDGSTIYILADGNHGVGFYLLKADVEIPAGKAYLQVAAVGSESSREFIAIAGEATAIKTVETEKANGAIYNLAGQQVKKAQKGIFIMNGKKVIK